MPDYTFPLVVNGQPVDADAWYNPVASAVVELGVLAEAITAPGWTEYTPSWTSSGTQPAIGNGTIGGRYRRVSGSDLVIVEGLLTAGGTTTFGTGTYFLSAPVAPSATAVARSVGACYLLDSGTLDKIGMVKFEDSTKWTPVAASGGVVTPTNPHTMASGDQIRWVSIYEPLA